MTTRALPDPLHPLICLPAATSLTLLTGLTNATTPWLLTRYLQSLLPARRPTESADDVKSPAYTVILLSFLRPLSFWTENASKLGIDIPRQSAIGNFTFIDGLTNLLLPPSSTPESPSHLFLTSPVMQTLTAQLTGYITATGKRTGKPVVLLVDQPDALIALTETTFPQLQEMVLNLRELSHSVILSISLDDPFILENHPLTSKIHPVFAIDLSHQADLTLSLRPLDTGHAKDFSGIMRIDYGPTPRGSRPAEFLYKVSGDGRISVFSRDHTTK